MSLDVYLTLDDIINAWGNAILISEDGQTKEISPDEWGQRFPYREPVRVTVYSANITHNLGKMASRAGLYQYLWRPEELSIRRAKELIQPLKRGLAVLEKNPKYYKRFNPKNGWGSYEGLVTFVKSYLEACRMYPEAEVKAWR